MTDIWEKRWEERWNNEFQLTTKQELEICKQLIQIIGKEIKKLEEQ